MSASGSRSGSHQFDADRVANLLAQLDTRLRSRGVAAAVFVVGGAAIAATGIRAGRLTADIDVLTRDQVVMEEARALAVEEGL
jgi:GTPase